MISHALSILPDRKPWSLIWYNVYLVGKPLEDIWKDYKIDYKIDCKQDCKKDCCNPVFPRVSVAPRLVG